MTVGTSLQLATSLFFVALFLVYFRRLVNGTNYSLSLRERTGRIFWGIVAMEFFIIVRYVEVPSDSRRRTTLNHSSSHGAHRGCYRTAELSEGLFGKLGRTGASLTRSRLFVRLSSIRLALSDCQKSHSCWETPCPCSSSRSYSSELSVDPRLR